MDNERLFYLADRFLSEWNTQEIEKVLACYTDDLEYWDPNTRGVIFGAEAMRHYLKKLFAAWRMTWNLRSAHLLHELNGGAILWRASFRRPGREEVVEAVGMDLVVMRGDRIQRNEVYFDRAGIMRLADHGGSADRSE
jgi:hypothetical protein